MNATPINLPTTATEAPDQPPLGETVRRERGRLLAFIRRRLPDPDEAEDVLQDVFVELTEAYQLAKPIGRVASWLFAVARNKISDWYRRTGPNGERRTVSLNAPAFDADEEDGATLTDWLTAPDGDDPDSTFFRETLMDALTDALAELPAEQRDAFVQNELEGRPFRELAAESGVSINTLLSRKRYAVAHLRERLRDLYDDLFDDN